MIFSKLSQYPQIFKDSSWKFNKYSYFELKTFKHCLEANIALFIEIQSLGKTFTKSVFLACFLDVGYAMVDMVRLFIVGKTSQLIKAN